MDKVLCIETKSGRKFYTLAPLRTHEIYGFPKRFIECTDYKDVAIKVAKGEKESFGKITTFVVADELETFFKVNVN